MARVRIGGHEKGRGCHAHITCLVPSFIYTDLWGTCVFLKLDGYGSVLSLELNHNRKSIFEYLPLVPTVAESQLVESLLHSKARALVYKIRI